MANQEIKEQVHDFWNEASCGTFASDKTKHSKEYYEDIENFRYKIEPEIFSFAQFSRFRNQKVLEVGVGAGSDFMNWVRSGCQAYGIDLTPEAIEHVENRLSIEKLKAKDLKVADSEHIPFEDDYFDLVYSWGVIHHTPDTEKALDEIIRVCKKGGRIKLMLYHRKSILSYFFWVKHALLKGKPFKSLKTVLYNHMESYGTKAYTVKEVENMINGKSIANLEIKTILTYYDRMERHSKGLQVLASIFARMFGHNKVGWFMTIEMNKKS